MTRISPSEFKELLPEGMQKLFNNLAFTLMRHGGIKKTQAEEIALNEFLKIKNSRINYMAMPSVERDSLVSQGALKILDESRKREVKHEGLYSCKRCGVKTSFDSYWGYRDKCNEEFDTAIRNGALVLYKPTFHAESKMWEIRRYSPDKSDVPALLESYSDFDEFQAIVEARKIAKKKRIDKVVFEYLPTHPRWFLDEYLKTNPNLKEEVIRANKGFFEKVKEYVRQKKIES